MKQKFKLDENGIVVPLDIYDKPFKSISSKINDKKLDIIAEKPVDTAKKSISKEKVMFNALDLYNSNIVETPKLLNPFLQKVGLASIVGSSDTGKSSFLRQLALSVALGKDTFLGFKLNTTTQKVLYISTEDDPNSTNAVVKKQLNGILEDSSPNNLKNLNFIFDTENLLKVIKETVSKTQYDLVVIDAFADVFGKEINSNTQVRQFLNDYHKIARTYECLIIFLHHNGKRTEKGKPSKNNIIGSQAFEAKMRSVLDLSQSRTKNHRNLTLLKCNFLSSDYKNKSYVLKFNENLVFENTNTEIAINKLYTKKENPAIIKEVLKLRKEENLSTRKIEEQLKGTKLEVSKSVISEIIKKNAG